MTIIFYVKPNRLVLFSVCGCCLRQNKTAVKCKTENHYDHIEIFTADIFITRCKLKSCLSYTAGSQNMNIKWPFTPRCNFGVFDNKAIYKNFVSADGDKC